MKDSQLALLAAVRSAASALILAIDDFAISIEPVPPDPNAPCVHPSDDRISLAAMNNVDRYYCKVCKQIIE